MTTASLELCKELYELSNLEWVDTPYAWFDYGKSLGVATAPWDGRQPNVTAPAYPLGYLLRKLPENILGKYSSFHAWLSMDNLGSDGWQFGYRVGAAKPEIKAIADTPEDAACKLLCELIKQKVITP